MVIIPRYSSGTILLLRNSDGLLMKENTEWYSSLVIYKLWWELMIKRTVGSVAYN